jgi:ferrochelatase
MTEMTSTGRRIGVLLFNLGGPETLEDVRPFLFNLFADPDIIRLPWRALQKPLAWLISTQRHKKSRGYYEKIGGGSPLRRITEEQARALEQALAKRKIDARAYVGMRYWNPFIEEALDQIKRDQIEHLVILPLYPQFSVSTTGSSLNRMQAIVAEKGDNLPRTSVICSWEADPNYIEAMAAAAREELALFPDQDPSQTHILFSAHSVPVRYIE